MIKYGAQIKKYRKLAGLSQLELAKKCGWVDEDGGGRQSLVGNYETEAREPGIEKLEQIAEACGVSLTELLTDTAGTTTAPDSKYIASRFAALNDDDKKILLQLVRHLDKK